MDDSSHCLLRDPYSKDEQTSRPIRAERPRIHPRGFDDSTRRLALPACPLRESGGPERQAELRVRFPPNLGCLLLAELSPFA